MSNKKNLSIETLRGAAILLVVIGHVIGSAPDGGMKIDFPHPLRYLYIWIDYIQMPLFTAIAGWVYALKPFSASSSFKSFAKKKAMRLLLPMAVVGTLYFVVQYFTPGTNGKGNINDIWRIYVFPYTVYWYLPSLFLIFMIQWWADKCRCMNNVKNWGVCLLIALLLCIAERYLIPWEVPNLFSFKGALNQLPYFVVGVGVQRLSTSLYKRCLNAVYVICIVIGIILLQFEWFYPLTGKLWYEFLQPIWVFATLILLLRLKWKNRFLSWLGGYAYSIYLLHSFGTSGGRIILKMLGMKSTIFIFSFATFIAVFGPILADRVCSRFRILRVALLGKS